MTVADNIKITQAILDEKPILRQLLELYEYDFSEFEGTEIGLHGFFGYKYLDHYWTEPDRYPYLIRVNDHLAGFVLVNRHGASSEDRWSIAEFFVMRKYRNLGIGAFAAAFIFDLRPGKWEVSQSAAHPASTVFWRKVIRSYTSGQFEERHGEDKLGTGPYQLFDNSAQGN